MMTDEYSVTRKSLDTISELQENIYIPIGSVEFIKEYCDHFGVSIPQFDTYPEELNSFLGRNIELIEKGNVDPNKFVKPISTKQFTGFVGTDTDEENLKEFSSLNNNTLVYQSDVVDFVYEYRYYVADKKIKGWARYDQNDSESFILPEAGVVLGAIEKCLYGTYTIDFGVTSNNKTLLVECNDFWAIGYYQGNLGVKDYIELLIKRWREF